MRDQPKTLADICARIRTIDEPMMRDLDFIAVFLEFLPRDIEAAAEREREAYCDLCKEKDAAYDRLLLERDKAIKARSPGNAAALRDALVAFVDSVQWLCDGDERGIFKRQFAPLLSNARAALAAPARNCDVSLDTKKTIERCLADLNVESSSASFDAGVCAAIGWMLAAPSEGGAK